MSCCCLAEKYHLCAQLYTVRDYCKTPADIAETLKKIAAIGYKLVQVSGLGPISGEELAAACKDAGVAAVGSHIAYGDWIDKYDEKLAFLRAIGCKYTAIPAISIEFRKDAAAWADTAEKFGALGRKLIKDGIILQYHNHRFEFEKFDGRTGLEILYKKTAADDLQAEIDTCWVARGGDDPAKWVFDVAGRMDQIHLKDSVIVDDKEQFAEIGEGNLNWHAILWACKKTSVKHYIVEQDGNWKDNDPFKSLAISYEYLTKKHGLI